jgi:hypothetical protein
VTYHFEVQAKDNIRKCNDERLPGEYEKCLVGLTFNLKGWMDYSGKDLR